MSQEQEQFIQYCEKCDEPIKEGERNVYRLSYGYT